MTIAPRSWPGYTYGMRYIVFPGQYLARAVIPVVILTFLAACGPLIGGGKTSGEPVPGPDPEIAEVGGLSDPVPDESAMRPADSSLAEPQNTIAGLGDPGKPGLWLETPLVKVKGPGRIRLATGGGVVAVTLLPVPGEATAGSRLSLDAMRQLGAPLTELVEITVTSGG